MADTMAESRIFPGMALEMTAIGEQIGDIGSMLAKAANLFEVETTHTVERVSSLLEPVLIVLMAVIIGFICISVLLPMLDLYQIL